MGILLDHGLRVGEVAILRVKNFDLNAGRLTFKRPKVNKTQTHTLMRRTLETARAYFVQDAPAKGIVWRSSKWRGYKGDRQAVGTLGKQGMTVRAITKRVKELGERSGRVISPRLPALLGYSGGPESDPLARSARIWWLEFSGHAHALHSGKHGRQRWREVGLGLKRGKGLPGSFQNVDLVNSRQNPAPKNIPSSPNGRGGRE